MVIRIRKMASFQEIVIELLYFNSLNLRGILRSPEQIERIANSIAQVGLLDHPIVSDKGNRFLVIGGESRILAYQLLLKRNYPLPPKILCKTLQGITEKTAMKILAQENMVHAFDVAAATNNEIYWHYCVDIENGLDHNTALTSIKGIWENTSYVFNQFIVPGWMLYHSHTVQNLLQKIGPMREGITDAAVQKIAKHLRDIPSKWWRIIASPFKPADPPTITKPPSWQDVKEFEEFLEKAFYLLGKNIEGERAVKELEQAVLPSRHHHLEGQLATGFLSKDQRDKTKREIGQVKKMMKVRRRTTTRKKKAS